MSCCASTRSLVAPAERRLRFDGEDAAAAALPAACPYGEDRIMATGRSVSGRPDLIGDGEVDFNLVRWDMPRAFAADRARRG